MVSANRRIQNLVDEFVRNVAVVAREEAARAVLAANVHGAAPRGNAAPLNGKKRPAAILARLETRLVEYVARHPGVRTEQINAALGTTTAEIARPIRKLVEDKSLRSSGIARGTRYFAVDTRPRSQNTSARPAVARKHRGRRSGARRSR